MFLIRIIVCFSLVVGAMVQMDGAESKGFKADLVGFKNTISPIIQKNCIDCHGPKKVKGKFRIDQINPDLLQGEDVSQWFEVYEVLSHSEMPPDDEPDFHLSESLRGQFVDWLGQEIQKATLFRKDQVRHSSFRRLANYEYNAVLQDLLGLPYQFAQDLPPETKSEHGFKNSSEFLNMTPMQFELYRKLALKALKKAIVIGDQPKVQSYRIPMSELFAKAIQLKQKNINEPIIDGRLRGVPYLLNNETGEAYFYHWYYNKASWHFKPKGSLKNIPKRSNVVAVLKPGQELRIDLGNTIPDRGEFRVRIRVGKDMRSENNISGLRLSFGSKMSNEGRFSKLVNDEDIIVSSNIESPNFIEYSFPLQEMPRNPFRKVNKLGEYPNPSEYLAIKHVANLYGERAGVKLHIDYVEIDAGVYEQWPPKSHRDIFMNSKIKDNEKRYSGQILKRFMTRAWRRPVSNQEVEEYQNNFLKIRPAFSSFEEAMIEVLSIVLSSPEFLYIKQDLASRLSFFLWSSIPDEELLEHDRMGRLNNPKTIVKQVDRMLSDPRAKRFIKHFVKGWLHLDDLGNVSVDKIKFRRFYQDRLKEDMASEPIHFFKEVLKHNHSIFDFIQSDYLMVTSRLAKHYDLQNVKGNHFRRVNIKPQKVHRGGLLTTAAVMTMNADGLHSSPLSRGVWLLENILNAPPPPPPPNVPEVDLTDPRVLNMTQKQRMEDHRNKAACKSCHVKIDPWGIAFEHYDAIGRYRSKLNRKEIDASTLINGKVKVNNAYALKEYLLNHRKDQFTQAMTHKLTSYALGRPLSFSDRYELEKMTSQLKKKGYGMKDLLYIICQSDLFKANLTQGRKHD